MKDLRIYTAIFLYALVSTVLTSCTQEESFPSKNEPVVSLQLQLGKSSRATIAGVDDLNENKVSTIDVFLFKADADDNQAAIYHGSVSGSGITYDGVTRTASFNLNISAGKYNTLFPRNDVNTCKAYFIVNRPQGSVLPELANCSLTALKKLVIQSSQFQTVDETTKTDKRILTRQPLFVMDGFADDITRDVNTMQLSRTQPVPVARAAVKIQLLLESISDNVTDGGKTWNADKDNVRIMLRNGVNRGYLNEAVQASYLINTVDKDLVNDIFHLENISLDVKDGGNLTTSYPMYMYPTYWGDNDAIRPVLILTIDWVNAADNTEKKTTYYEIPVNAASDYLVRNNFYQIKQKVTVIGSEEIEDPVRLYPSTYVILDWGNVKDAAEGTTDTDAEVNMPRYLVLEEKEVVMQNTRQKDLKYFTSHPIKIQNLKVQRMDTSGNTADYDLLKEQAELTATYDDATKTYTYTVNYNFTINSQVQNKTLTLKIHDEDGYISLIHDLKNEMNATSDYMEYVFTFDVVHSDQPAYKESVKVEQYPMIAIKADLNSDYRNDNNNDNDNVHKGYVYLNNAQANSGTPYRVYGLVGTGNANPNRYKISVSSLTEQGGEKYIIGDPRSKNTYNPGDLRSDDAGKTLANYYPTDETVATRNMISPLFMIASSYGVAAVMTKDNARKRCSAYQEDGYPAGRWRIPTRAEIQYIMELSEWGVIPVLFDKSSEYWSAQGAVIFNNQNGVNDADVESAGIRCVYDIWYWGDNQLENRDYYQYGGRQR